MALSITFTLPGRLPGESQGRRWGRIARIVAICCLLVALAPVGGPPIVATPVRAPAGLKYTIEADIDFAGAYVTAWQRVEWQNFTASAVNELVFNVTPAQYRAFELRGCRVAAQECTARRDGVVYEIPLPTPVEPGGVAVVELKFFLDVPEPGNLRFGKAGNILALGNWHPTLAVYRTERTAGKGRPVGWARHQYTDVGDAFYTEAADYDVTVRASQAVTIAASGRRIEASDSGGRYVGASLRDFALALSDRFEVVSTEVNGTKISVFSTAKNAAGADVALNAAAVTLRFMESNVGPYVWSELHIVETTNFQQAWDGQEYTGLTFISSHIMAQPGPPGSYLWYLVAHEVVHQWFFAAVGNDQLFEPWLDEAPATQLAWLALRSVSNSAYNAAWERLKARWATAKTTYGDRPISVGVYDYRPANEDAYFATVYRKGALFLDEARLALGDDEYFAMLREYYTNYLYRIATPNDFFALLRARLGSAASDRLIAKYFG